MKIHAEIARSVDISEVERVEGNLAYIKGHPYPFKNLPTEERIQTVNTLKGILRLKPQAFIEAIEYVLQYDWAYRLRFLDLCNETTVELLQQNPRKELKRLMLINKEREMPANEKGTIPDHLVVHKKLNRFAQIIRIALLYPPFKRRFKQMAQNLPKPDEIDKYWMRLRTDYNSGV